MSGMWPNFGSVAGKCEKVLADHKEGKDIMKFKTSGTEDKRIIEARKKHDVNN
jgi:hypothetical protein